MIKRNQPSNEEVIGKIDETFDTLDTERSEGLKRIKLIQNIQSSTLVKEKARLEQKYGADHPRVKKIVNRLAYNKGAVQELNVEIERSKISVPEFDLNTWLVHGRVIDSDGNAQEGLTVSFCDEGNSWVRQLGHVCTDQRGYYVLRYSVEKDETPELGEKDNFYLTVTDSTHKLLHRETEPLQVSIGHLDYRLIIISGTPCIFPEPDGVDGYVVPPDGWVVRGVVLYEDKTPAAGLTVSLYDSDLIFDDVLGSVLTDNAGRFHMIYRTDAFRDFFEKKPDLYLKVIDAQGKQLYCSKKEIRINVGKVEEFNIILKTEK
jgi:hypothetical protein